MKQVSSICVPDSRTARREGKCNCRAVIAVGNEIIDKLNFDVANLGEPMPGGMVTDEGLVPLAGHNNKGARKPPRQRRNIARRKQCR